MAEPNTIRILCPRAECKGAIAIRSDGIAYCTACLSSVGVWRPPLRPTSGVQERPVVNRVWGNPVASVINAGLLVALVVGGMWLAGWQPIDGPRAAESPVAERRIIPFDELIEMIKSGAASPDVDLPELYNSAQDYFGRHGTPRQAHSNLFIAWQNLSATQKIMVLQLVNDSEDPGWLGTFLIEVVYFGAPLEKDARVSDLMRSSILSTAHLYPLVAIAILDHVGQTAWVAGVRAMARKNAQALRYRLGQYGQ